MKDNNNSFLLLGESQAIKKLNKLSMEFAASNANVLIEGEPGVGKVTLARQIHMLSKNTDKPFKLLGHSLAAEQELRDILGSKKSGSLPSGSTFCLKNIDELSFTSQIKVLKFLMQKKLKVRVIVTVKGSLEEAYKKEFLIESLSLVMAKFRKVHVPPLRERPEDIPVLTRHFVEGISKELGIRERSIDTGMQAFLRRHEFRGNVPELRNIIERSVYQSNEDRVTLAPEFLDEVYHLEAMIEKINAKEKVWMDQTFEKIESLLLRRMLVAHAYNQSRVAESLGFTEGNLRYRLKKYGMKNKSRKPNKELP